MVGSDVSLKNTQIQSTEPGMHVDSNGLYLSVMLKIYAYQDPTASRLKPNAP